MSDRTVLLEKRLKRTDKWYKLAFILFIIVITGLQIFMMYQLFAVEKSFGEQEIKIAEQGNKRLEKALDENEAAHRQTQRYVKCVFLIPEYQRNDTALRRCEKNMTVPEPLAVSPPASPTATMPKAREETSASRTTQQPKNNSNTGKDDEKGTGNQPEPSLLERVVDSLLQ